MYILSNMWFTKLIKQFFFWIDKVIYNFISTIYDLMITIARTSVLSQSDIIEMADRIYKLLAVFMIFKVTLSLITYVVNPDDFSDKSKGISKLGTNIVISLTMLILTPYIFNYAYQFQTIILEDNSLATLIFGEDNNSDAVEEQGSTFFNEAGNQMAFLTMRAFITPNLSFGELYQCANLMEDKNNFNETCKTELESLTNDNPYFSSTTLNNYVAAMEHENLGLLFRQDLVLATDLENEEFIMDYKFILSTVVGVVIILLLISFCMDVAIRSIKLAFLQLIAPIPIISYVDPKSGKDGMFKKWYQMCFKTFLSLFIRLLALYFAVYIISRVHGLVDIVDGSQQTHAFVIIFIIIGALMFAKQLPKILEGLGIKLDGDGKFFLNPLKKFEEQAVGGKRLTGAMGGLAASFPDRIARMAYAPGWKNKVKALAGAAPGLLGGAVRGYSSNGGLKGGFDKQAEFNRRLRDGRIRGLNSMSSYLDYYGSKFGLDDATLEKEATLTRENNDAIMEAKRNIAEKTRKNELNIKTEKQKAAPIKSIQTRRKNVKSSADKLMQTAESVAGKKADFRKTSLQQAQLNAISKLKTGAELNEEDKKILNSVFGPDGDTSEVGILKKEREINSNQYTTNRRADEANVKFLNDNQGKILNHPLIVGEGESQYVIAAGTYIDGSVVAAAQAAQGKYQKASKVAVYNEMTKANDGENESEYASLEEYKAFQSDYDEYESAKSIANEEIKQYNEKNQTDFELFEISLDKDGNIDYSKRNFKEAEGYSDKIKSGADSSKIKNIVDASDSEIERLTRANEEIQNNERVEYRDERGRIVKDENGNNLTIVEAESRNKPREEKVKIDRERHDLRRKYRGDVGMFPPGGRKK